MAKGISKPCKQCGSIHQRIGEICLTCRKANEEAIRPPAICPYCNEKKGRLEVLGSPYHSVCSGEVSAIRARVTTQVKRAIKQGAIQAISPETLCVDCGKPAQQYEHRHYSKPLDVVPVCRSCNQKRGPALDLHSFYLAEKAA